MSSKVSKVLAMMATEPVALATSFSFSRLPWVVRGGVLTHTPRACFVRASGSLRLSGPRLRLGRPR
jgi:hypothetical protein